MPTNPIKVYACRDCGRKVQETAADAAADAAMLADNNTTG
jgi:uncharacterized protein YlaI